MNDHGVLLWQERLEREQRVGPSFADLCLWQLSERCLCGRRQSKRGLCLITA